MVLVMHIYEAGEKERILANGVFNGSKVGLEAAVKNTSRPDGRRGPGAYYNFTDRSDLSKGSVGDCVSR
jgi:hypothetical protein